tara:strand:+ start:45 stop:323 length:279 start_codon:yes stop_codon:yes gene_type:complete
LFGTKISIKFNTIESKLLIGINGIKFRINNKNGKIAIKKLKEILPALAVRAPFKIPEKYISIRSKKEKLLNPGNLIESINFFTRFSSERFLD